MNQLQMQTGLARQQGAALIVSLVMMVVLTLIGVVAMNSSNIDLIMASNTQLSARALAAAERALSSAEAAVDGMDGYNFSTTGYYDIESGANEPMNPQDMDWDDSDSVEATIDDDGRYIVEYISWEPLDGASLALGGGGAIKPPGDFVDVYRVTARAEDAKGAVRMVQSIFVKRF